MTAEQKSTRNVHLYVFIKLFGKRVFLPLSAIYFMQVVGFSFAEIGLLGSFYFAVNFIADVPTGIFADRVGRAASIRIAAIFNICATLLYVLIRTKTGVVIGTAFEALGYAFLIGAGEALIHDSLAIKNQLKSYTKVISRAQSISLVLNAVLLALIPMTYAIDPRLPFLIGTLAYTMLLIAGLFMRDVAKPKKHKFHHTLLPVLKTKYIITFAIFFGIFGALYIAPSDLTNLSFKELGVHPAMLGWIFAAASLFGSILGVFFHHLRKLHVSKFIVIDTICLAAPFLAIALRSLPLLICCFIVSMSMWRYRRSIYQEKMLLKFPGKPKATLLSMMSNFEGIHLIWLPAVIGYTIQTHGTSNGFKIVFLFSILVGIGFYMIGRRFFGKQL